ncbi:Ubiquinone biosynthesis O-methyltransferase, partial [Schistosoma japonicum]
MSRHCLCSTVILLKQKCYPRFKGIERFQNFSRKADETEAMKFKLFAEYWWDPNGDLQPLHAMNRLRVPFIRNAAEEHVEATSYRWNDHSNLQKPTYRFTIVASEVLEHVTDWEEMLRSLTVCLKLILAFLLLDIHLHRKCAMYKQGRLIPIT